MVLSNSFLEYFRNHRIPFIVDSKNIKHINNIEVDYNFNYLWLENKFRSGLINSLIKLTERNSI